jgi:hypothetical protein
MLTVIMWCTDHIKEGWIYSQGRTVSAIEGKYVLLFVSLKGKVSMVRLGKTN